MRTNKEGITEEGLCAGEGCKHLTTLKDIRAAVRKIYHDMGQPLMVIQGYLELLELKKIDADVESLKQIMIPVSGQLSILKEIQMQLKESINSKGLKTDNI